jgi:hypothetical protein
MNERIKLLAKQAEIDYDLRPEIARAPVWIGTDEELEKFAELIVRECIDYCGENLSKTVGGALKIHFGVEE